MKKIWMLIAMVVSVCSASGLAAQDNQMYGDEWGKNATALERRDNVMTFNLYKEAYQRGNYAEATGYLNVLLEKCPAAAQNIYVLGINMLKKQYAGEDSSVRQRAIADSVAMLYGMRLEYFADDAKYGRPYILKQKAKDFALLFADDRELVNDAFEQAAEASGSLPDAELLVLWFRELTEVDYGRYGMPNEEYTSRYDFIIGSLRAMQASEEDISKVKELYLSSGATDGKNDGQTNH